MENNNHIETKKMWGEFEDEPENDQQNVNFNPIIELGMQNIPEISITVKTPPAQLPELNLVTHTIQLHNYYRQLQTIPEVINRALAKNLKPKLVIHDFPPQPENTLKLKHNRTPGTSHLPKESSDFSAGKGPVILPYTKESHKRALKQCGATALAFLGATACQEQVVETMADALDFFLTKFCQSLRNAVDRKASGQPIGFPDAISRVLHDLNMTDLGNYYQDYVVDYHATVQEKCHKYIAELEILTNESVPLPLEEVPELHFPAALDGAFTPSLETGFQMLQNLEQENLGLEFLELAGQESKPVELKPS